MEIICIEEHTCESFGLVKIGDKFLLDDEHKNENKVNKFLPIGDSSILKTIKLVNLQMDLIGI